MAICLTRTSHSDNANVQIEAHRLGKSELLSRITKELKSGKELTFASNEGEGLCYDVGGIILEIHPGRSKQAAVLSGFLRGV